MGTVISGIVTTNTTVEIQEIERVNLKALVDSNDSHGQAFMILATGKGEYGQEMVYHYYIEEAPNTYRYRSKEARYVTIIETDENVAYQKRVKEIKRCPDKVWIFPTSCTIEREYLEHNKFYVPKGTIQEGFNIDLQ